MLLTWETAGSYSRVLLYGKPKNNSKATYSKTKAKRSNKKTPTTAKDTKTKQPDDF